MKSFLFSTLIAAILLCSPAAHAMQAPSTDPLYLGLISPGSIGNNIHGTDLVTDYGGEFQMVSANLSGFTRVIFTYTLSASNGMKFEDLNPAQFIALPTGGTSVLPVTWVADNKKYVGSLTIDNLQAAISGISSQLSFFGDLTSFQNINVKLDYAAQKLSAVPLPAALPLFAAGVAGLAGLKRMRKRQSVA